MKRFLIFATLVAVSASACSITQFVQNPTPGVDTQATIDALVKISGEQTQAAQPSPTTVPPTQTSTPVLAFTPTATAVQATISATAPSSTPVTVNSSPTQAVTVTATKAVSPSRTPTATLGILLYGTLPPAVPSAQVTVINKSRAQAYISLQNYPPDKDYAFLEYPVEGQVKVNAPLGYYIYVVWVGGRKIVGEFRLHKNDSLTITIFKDKVEIK